MKTNLGSVGVISPSVNYSVPIQISVQIKPGQCTYTGSKNYTLPMGSILKGNFTGKGQALVPGFRREFFLNLTCDSGIPITLRMEGNAFDINNGILNTTATTDSAKGVGVKIYFDNNGIIKPFALNNDVSMGNSRKNFNNFHFYAGYIQTGSEVTTGLAKAVATFTFTYQ